MTLRSHTPTALVTGGSTGLGLALVRALDEEGWTVVTDARDPARLRRSLADTRVRAIPGDVTDPDHRALLVDAAGDRLDLLVLNASTLGPLPMRPLVELALESLLATFATNAVAHLALATRLVAALRRRDGILIGLSSDAAVAHYPSWGAYGASKAALDHLVLTLGAETGLAAYAVDPGDMRTPMHQDAFPGEDISDRPDPGHVVPHLLALLADRPPSARLVATEIPVPAEAGR